MGVKKECFRIFTHLSKFRERKPISIQMCTSVCSPDVPAFPCLKRSVAVHPGLALGRTLVKHHLSGVAAPVPLCRPGGGRGPNRPLPPGEGSGRHGSCLDTELAGPSGARPSRRMGSSGGGTCHLWSTASQCPLQRSR